MMKAPFSLDPLLKRYEGRRPDIVDIYRHMYSLAETLARPQQAQRTLPAASLTELAAFLPGAEQIMVGVCTIGPAVEEQVEQLFFSDPAAAVILDEIGTTWVKALAREMHDAFRAAAHAAGAKASPSYRPGIGRWPLALHQVIMTHVDVGAIDVRLAGDMLLPQKTISMIVAQGAALGRSKYACEHDHAAIC